MLCWQQNKKASGKLAVMLFAGGEKWFRAAKSPPACGREKFV